MVWMASAVVSMAAFANVIRHAQSRGCNMTWAGAACYLCCGLMCGGAWLISGSVDAVGAAEALWGGLSGATILAGYFLFSYCIRVSGVGVAQVFERISMLAAVLISVAVWRSELTRMMGVGVVLAALAIPLICKGSAPATGATSRWRVPMLFVLMIVTGGGSAALEAYRRLVTEANLPAFLVFQYAVIACGCLVAALARFTKPRRLDAGYGVVLSLLNLVFYYSSLRALSLPGSVVFPTIAVGTILAASLGAALLWRESYSRRTLAGMALAAAAIILINC